MTAAFLHKVCLLTNDRLKTSVISNRLLCQVAALYLHRNVLDLVKLWHDKAALGGSDRAFEMTLDIRYTIMDAIWEISIGNSMGNLYFFFVVMDGDACTHTHVCTYHSQKLIMHPRMPLLCTIMFNTFVNFFVILKYVMYIVLCDCNRKFDLYYIFIYIYIYIYEFIVCHVT